MKKEGLKLKRSIYYTLAFVALIWFIKIIEFTFHYNFGDYGILPRTLSGSIGIFTAPLIHGDIYHLLSNTFPIIILGIGLFYFYDRIALIVILLIYLMTGFWVWVAAREAYHIGASGLIYGMLTFLLFSGFLRRDPPSLAISFIVLFLYGGTFLMGILPTDSAISWESHLMGGIAGIFCAIYFRNYKLKKAVPEDQAEPNPAGDNYTYFYKQNIAPTQNPHEDEDKGDKILCTIQSPFYQDDTKK